MAMQGEGTHLDRKCKVAAAAVVRRTDGGGWVWAVRWDDCLLVRHAYDVAVLETTLSRKVPEDVDG